MEPNKSQQIIIEDKDAQFRLHHGLSVHCLAIIFQHLNIDELYKVGGMNKFFKHIINDLVIPNHYINWDPCVWN